MLKKIFCIVSLLFCITAGAQDVAESLKFGGITLDENYQKVLDQAKVGVTYKYTFAINKEDGSAGLLTDTLLLAIGDTYSVFLNVKHRDLLWSQAHRRMARQRGVKFNEIVDDFNSVVELINENSNYTEDDPGDPVQIFKNRSTGDVTSIYSSFLANIRHDQVIDEIKDWKITEEIDSILGYLCHKAIVRYGGRVYNAWFTLDIPINDGPWKLWGLPGLILRAIDQDDLFEWEAIGIQKIGGNIVIDDVDYEKATLSQFQDYVDKDTSTVMVDFLNNGIMYHADKPRGYSRIPHEIK